MKCPGGVRIAIWSGSVLLALCNLFAQETLAQQSTQLSLGTPATGSAVPRLVNYSGVLRDNSGRVVTGVSGVTFSIYKDEQGGAPLWLETQNVKPDTTGHYTVRLGAASAHGLPSEMFLSGEGRWLGVQIGSEPEQIRVLLVAVPYAMKAADAETVGGLPPSAFVLAAPFAANGVASLSTTTPAVLPPATVTGSGTSDYIPLWTGTTVLTNSVLFQTGSGSSAKIGINSTTPAATLDVAGGATIRGLLNLPNAATATASAGADSRPLGFAASVFSSSAKAATNQVFHWQAEPVNNNTSSATATLNLLFAVAPATAAETGLKINNKGQFTFASGQTFPGTGTVSSVALSAPTTDFTVSGSPVTSSGTLKFAWKVAPTNADTASAIVKRDANGAFSSGEITASSLGTITAAVTGTNSVSGFGVLGFATGTSGQGVWGESLGTQFSTSNGQGADGVHGETHTNAGSGVAGLNSDPAGIGVFGQGTGYYTTGSGYGVYGVGATGIYGVADNNTTSGIGTGVFGQNGSESVIGSNLTSKILGITGAVGVWADGGSTAGSTGVIATTDDGNAAVFVNNSSSGFYTVFINAQNKGTSPFVAGNAGTGQACSIDANANLKCAGTLTGIAELDGGARKVALSAIQSPKNWFEDAGSAQLANGAAMVRLDPDFAQTVNTEVEYNVFLTPYGDCKGLYVANRTANSFEVRELGGGSSGISFGYRIMALRKKYENVRFADHTHDPDLSKQVTPRKNPSARVALPARATVPRKELTRLHAAQRPKVN
jgi:hypothetical protein